VLPERLVRSAEDSAVSRTIDPRTSTFGATAARADDLRRDMAAAPRLLQKRFTHQQAVRREMERDAEDTEARAAARKKGNARRPSRRRGR